MSSTLLSAARFDLRVAASGVMEILARLPSDESQHVPNGRLWYDIAREAHGAMVRSFVHLFLLGLTLCLAQEYLESECVRLDFPLSLRVLIGNRSYQQWITLERVFTENARHWLLSFPSPAAATADGMVHDLVREGRRIHSLMKACEVRLTRCLRELSGLSADVTSFRRSLQVLEERASRNLSPVPVVGDGSVVPSPTLPLTVGVPPVSVVSSGIARSLDSSPQEIMQ